MSSPRHLHYVLRDTLKELYPNTFSDFDLNNSDLTIAPAEDYREIWIYVGEMNGRVTSYLVSYIAFLNNATKGM